MTDARSNGPLEARPIERTDRAPATGQARQRSARRPVEHDPNYPARRMLVSAGVIALVIVGIAFVWQQFRGDDPPAATEQATWDAIALLGRGTGDANVVDRSGEITARHTDLGRVTAFEVGGGRVALIGTAQIVLTDLTADARPVVVPVERGAEVTRLPTRGDHLLLAIGQPESGGDVTIVDGVTGASFGIGELAGIDEPRMFPATIRADPDGSAIAIADAGSFQTIVVRRPEGDAADGPAAEWTVENYAAIPLAVGEGLVATSQVVGQRADIALHAAPDEPATPASAGIPVGGVIDDDQLVVVTTEGAIERIGLGDGEARRVGELELPDGAVVSAVHPTLAGQRLVVVAEQFLAVVDLEGNVLYPSDEPADEASEPAALAADPPWGARCIALTPASSDGNAAIVSLTDGVVLAAEPADAVLDVSADGCTVLTRSAGEVAVLADGRLARLGSATSARLAPDGRAAAVWRDVRTLELIVFDDSLEPEPPIDLTSALPATRSDVVFLDR